MHFKSLFGTGQQPWALAGCLLEAYSSSNCPAFFPWENVGNSPNYWPGSGMALPRWLCCIRSCEPWRSMGRFGLPSLTRERSWPSPIIVRYLLVRTRGICSSSSPTRCVLVLGATGDLPSLRLLLWSATVPKDLSFLFKITKCEQILPLLLPLIYKALQCWGERIWGLKLLIIVCSTPLKLGCLYSTCKKIFVLICSRAVCGQNLARVKLSYQVPLKSRVHQLRLGTTWAAAASEDAGGLLWAWPFCCCLSLRASVEFYAGTFSIRGIGNVSTCRKQKPCAQGRAEAALGPSCCPWPIMCYLGLRGQYLFCLCQWTLETSSLTSSLMKE